ncbi:MULTISPECIES: dioxygenase family protein [unclassified Nocardioides]|uniref:dioxygenase family protein n=1 Tax=unclassified Nocardioides TaxID=2615069 RepID=UPI0006F374DB|nr:MULTISPECIES: class III extradiol ring-cleavage dioxygenase [unclassified Nocardioides]KRA31284.1 extradiol ring-cleavage dioxygenase [Nocardioides sp. Root614]KRA87905.1 extradiol ring-cleavage dioxygenase [Nocardioides sp. Root682]
MDTNTNGRMPALYLGHGAPPLLDDPVWSGELAAWAHDLPRPKAILIVSAHWESAPLSLSANHAPLVYDFGGFAPKYYQMTYETPDNSALAARIAAMMPKTEPVHQHTSRGLDHGAWVPLRIMYPEADIPVLQMSMPTHDPGRLMEIGRRLQSLRDEGVLIIGSGFLTHGLPFLTSFQLDAKAPGWSKDFDAWAGEAMARGDVDELASYRDKAPGMPYAHPTVEHYSPLFVTLGAATDPTIPGEQVIDGFWLGLSKRSLQVA